MLSEAVSPVVPEFCFHLAAPRWCVPGRSIHSAPSREPPASWARATATSGAASRKPGVRLGRQLVVTQVGGKDAQRSRLTPVAE